MAILLFTLIFCCCIQQKSIEGLPIESSQNQLPEAKTELQIVSGPTRGIGFTDSLGSEYIIVHVTNTITNDSAIPIHLQIDLPIEFSYPIPEENHKFKIALWPGLTEPPHMYSDRRGVLRKDFKGNDWRSSNQFDQLLAPGEEYVVTIGTISPREPRICSVVAYSLLEYTERENYSDCDWTMEEEEATDHQSVLGLQVGFCTSGRHYERCMIVTCGQITYIED